MSNIKVAFSEFEIKNASIKFNDEEEGTFEKLGCVGSLEEELEILVVTKKCEGVIAKSRSIGTGAGSLTASLHMRYDLFVKAFGMDIEGLADGVYAYGKNSRNKEFTFVAQVKDEDGNVKYVAYPKVIMTNAPTGSIENGVEEIAEIEIEMSLMPDDYGNCKYQAVASELDETIANQWMSAWTPELMQKTE